MYGLTTTGVGLFRFGIQPLSLVDWYPVSLDSPPYHGYIRVSEGVCFLVVQTEAVTIRTQAWVGNEDGEGVSVNRIALERGNAFTSDNHTPALFTLELQEGIWVLDIQVKSSRGEEIGRFRLKVEVTSEDVPTLQPTS